VNFRLITVFQQALVKKINPDKLKDYVAQHPDAYQKEMAREFGCSQSAIQKALKRLKITRKKKQRDTKSRITTK